MSSFKEQKVPRLLKALEIATTKQCLYAEWPQIRETLLSVLTIPPSTAAETSSSSSSSSSPPPPPRPLEILVPGCCNLTLSEHLYDAGFHHITNIDVSKAHITEMLKRNVRSRTDMKWRVMDMTNMQFADEAYDTVLDNGRLDALMNQCSDLGYMYMLEVKRVLQKGGKFICLTLGGYCVLGRFFEKFRYGWRVSVHALPLKPSITSILPTYLVIAEKDSSSVLELISLAFDPISLTSWETDVCGLSETFKLENKIRSELSNSSDIPYPVEDVFLGVKGVLAELSPGQRISLIMGEAGFSLFLYRAVLLDSPKQADSDSFLCDCEVFLVEKTRVHEWLFSSEEGQWMVVESSKASRLIMVFLDSSFTEVSIDVIQKDLYPLVKVLKPWKNARGSKILCRVASERIERRKLIHQVTPSLTGPIIVDEVVYEKVADIFLHTSEELLFRRLIFPSSQNLVQSQVLLKREEPLKDSCKNERKNKHSSKSKKRGKQRSKIDVSLMADSSNGPEVDHDYLVSPYHAGIISGFGLISSYLEMLSSTGQSVKATIIGLGAGMLPMFLQGCLPFIKIEVVELDPVVPDLARDFFGFKEDERLMVHVADGVQYVRDRGLPKAVTEMTGSCEDEDASCSAGPSASCGSSLKPVEVGECSNRVDILIVDVDSSDSSSGMVCPAKEFVEESFLLSVKGFISEQGLFIINLLSRSAAMKAVVISRMKTVFPYLYSFQIDADVYEIIFALKTEIDYDPQVASQKLWKLLNLNNPATAKRIIDGIHNIKILK